MRGKAAPPAPTPSCLFLASLPPNGPPKHLLKGDQGSPQTQTHHSCWFTAGLTFPLASTLSRKREQGVAEVPSVLLPSPPATSFPLCLHSPKHSRAQNHPAPPKPRGYQKCPSHKSPIPSLPILLPGLPLTAEPLNPFLAAQEEDPARCLGN